MKFEELTEAEENLVEIIWQEEPIKSADLVTICKEKFDWKKSTTYTMLKRTEKKNIVKNEDSIVKSCLSKKDYEANKSKSFLEKHFAGSLPKFLAAFTGNKKLSDKEINELEKLIQAHKEE